MLDGRVLPQAPTTTRRVGPTLATPSVLSRHIAESLEDGTSARTFLEVLE